MRASVVFLAVAMLFIVGCTKNVICTTPYTLVGDQCCLDKNGDSICDESQHIVDVTGKKLVESKDLPELQSERTQEATPTRETLAPTLVHVSDNPFKGREDAKVVLVEFGDYYDRFSQRFDKEVLPKILERYGDDVLYVYRDFPLSFGMYKTRPAEAANCANEQGRFWEYHNKLFESTINLGQIFLEGYARQLGLDTEKFKECLLARRYSKEVINDIEAGRSYGVTLTPTVFIDNEKILGYHDFEFYKNILDGLLKEDLAKKIESRKEITVDAVGKAYLILEGQAALDPQVKNSMYTNNVKSSDASLYAQAEDVTLGGKNMQDSGKMTLTVKIKKYEEMVEEVYNIKLKSLLTDAKHFGGVATGLYVFGDTGVGTNLLPRVYAPVAIFGKADVFDKKDRLIASDLTIEIYVTQGIREEGILKGTIDKYDSEAYVIIPGKYAGESFPNEQGFLNVFFENVNFKVF